MDEETQAVQEGNTPKKLKIKAALISFSGKYSLLLHRQVN